MNTFWENVKRSVETGTKAVKDTATSVSDKTQEIVTLSQLKIKHYNLSRDVSNKFTELGRNARELMKDNSENIYSNPGISKLLDEVNKSENEIKKIEHEMEELEKKEAEGA
jgi:septal ring factor EnvC (AmiA/AmiB activator)